ncbi:MAG TPA: ABC transporter permease [Candidatus Dormibacteraeota bacterium]|nr:ABC transporter permease [Candidatus Dormibacteraeota bacterium]
MTDLRYALRQLVKSPGFTVIAIATLALAIGANSAVFSLINALLVRPLPYQQPSRLALIWERFATQALDRIPVSPPEYLDLEKEFRSTTNIAAFTYQTFNLGGGDVPERISGAIVSPTLFPLLGVEPIKGRTFAREEQGQGHDDVIVISERLWKRRFNSDPALVGKALLLNGRSYTVIGIMPDKFEFPIPLFGVQGSQFGESVDIWKPLAFTPLELKERGSRSYALITRLRSDVSVAKAQAELDKIIANWIQTYRDNYGGNSGFGARIYPLHDQVIGGMRTGLAILLSAVIFVLLIACANLATMLLARASARERELAIRVALGATRWRLLRQMLTESVLLAFAGAVVGIFLSLWGLELIKQIGARTVPRLAEVNVDLVVLVVTAVVAVGTGILFGLIPAFASAKPELTEALKEGGRSSTTGARRNQVRNSLVVAEIALALVLLVGAGLLLKSYARVQNIDPAFDRHNVLTAEMDLPDTKYPQRGSADYNHGAAMINFWNQALRRVQQLPGVEAAGAAIVLPLSGSNTDSSFAIEGRSTAGKEPTPDEELRVITPDYFRVLKTPLLRGRFFSESDNIDAPGVVIVNDALAKKYWPSEEALGKRITLDDPRKNPKWLTIVGIVRSIRHRSLDGDPQPEYYLPFAQGPERTMVLSVRSAQDPRSLTSAVRREIQSIDPDQPIANVRTLEAVTADSIAPRRMSVVLLGAFAGIALLLASVGIYGVISYLVVQRTHEIGVRMALGAQRSDVLRLIVGHAANLVGIGTLIGLVLAFLSTRLLSALLYNVGAFDVTTFLFVTIALATVALFASYIPAHRAARADPVVALGHDV